MVGSPVEVVRACKKNIIRNGYKDNGHETIPMKTKYKVIGRSRQRNEDSLDYRNRRISTGDDGDGQSMTIAVTP